MVEQRKYAIASSVKDHIKSSVDLFYKGMSHDFPLSVNPDQVTPSTEKLPENLICFVCKRVPVIPCKDKNCGQYFCVSCWEIAFKKS